MEDKIEFTQKSPSLNDDPSFAAGYVAWIANYGNDNIGMRRFVLKRTLDIHGSSGTGYVAEGIKFSDGTCVIRWLTSTSSTSVYKSVADLLQIHGHQGATTVVWIDN